MAKSPSSSPLSGALPKAVAQRTAHTPSSSPLANVKLAPESHLPEVSAEDREASSARAREIMEHRALHGETRGRLDYEARPGFHRRWVSDLVNGRVKEFERRGWTVVKDHSGQPVSRGVGVHVDGGKLPGVLMEIPDEIYDMDFDKKQETQDRRDEAIYRGTHNEEAGDKRYVPRDTPIKFSVGPKPGSQR